MGIFFPIINIITAVSIIKSVIALLASGGFLSLDGGLYQVFYAVSDGFFYFLPFFLAIAAAKQWKLDPFLALLVPVAMLYPGLTAILEEGESLSFLGLTIPPTIYHASVIPVLFALLLLKALDRPLDRLLPEAVRGFLKPICCMLVVLPVTFLAFGPIGSLIGTMLTRVFAVIYDANSMAAGGFMGMIMQPMVVVGAHWSVVPVSISNIATQGFDTIMPLVGGAVYAQSGAALAVALLCRKEQPMRRVALQASLTAALGVTEPALFGVNVPLGRPMIAACLAGAVGGAMVGAAGTHCTSFAFPSFLTSVAYAGPGFAAFLASMAVCFVLGFVLTIVQKKQLQKLLESRQDNA